MHLSIQLFSLSVLALLVTEGDCQETGDATQLTSRTTNEQNDRLLRQIADDHVDANEENAHFENSKGQSKIAARVKRQAFTWGQKWPNNTVYYFIDKSLPQETRNVIKPALKEIEDRSCVKFVESQTAPNRIKLFYGSDCSSDFGMMGGQQDLSLGPGCGRAVGNIQHEFFHALGFIHTQSREDRDKYITVDIKGLVYADLSNLTRLREVATEI